MHVDLFADLLSRCSASCQCALRPMRSSHTGLQCFDHRRIRGGCFHLHHVTIHLLLWWARVVGYWFCYQNTSSTTGVRVNITTVLLLEDMGANYQVVVELNVTAEPGRDSCLSGSPGGQCCVTRSLGAESQFGVNSSYLYAVVDLPDGPNMRQTHSSVGRPGYLFNIAVYTQSGGTLRKSGNPRNQPLKMFQFISSGESRLHLFIC